MNKKSLSISEVKKNVGEVVMICGFVQTIRDQGKIKFVMLRNGGELLQIVLLSSSPAFVQSSGLTLESVVEVTGTVKQEKQAPGGFEISADEIKILSSAQPSLPIPVVTEKGGEESDISLRFDYRWLDLRKQGRKQIFEAWTELERGFRNYYHENGFIQIYTPSFMDAPSESGAEVFKVDYFERKAFLAQSPQFYKQMAMASDFGRVFVMGPVFRAEPSYTTRHMTEFTGWDFEISYVDSHCDVMKALEDVIVAGFKQVKESGVMEIEVPATPFPKISMEDAKKRLSGSGLKSEKPGDVTPEEERELCRIMKEETGHDFVFLVDYPIESRPFYHMRHEDNPGLTKSFDLLYKGIEITTGAQREHRVEFLEAQATEKGLSLESIKHYLDFFRYGCPPHGGVGIGPGRIIMQMLDLPSVKEATFLPRDVKRLIP
ncbi:MAG: aspartate--tRNA(Asn) ligase [Patescibacteria group bacterium]|jgi:aspartyl-tRNA synthetase